MIPLAQEFGFHSIHLPSWGQISEMVHSVEMSSIIPQWCQPGNLRSLSQCLEMRAGLSKGSCEESTYIKWLELSHLWSSCLSAIFFTLFLVPYTILKHLSFTNLIFNSCYNKDHFFQSSNIPILKQGNSLTLAFTCHLVVRGHVW